MKKLLLCGLLLFGLAGCGSYSDSYNWEVKERFVNISDERFLFYEKDTKVIYYFINGWNQNDGCYSMPYISENGYYCRYEDGKIVEIKNED